MRSPLRVAAVALVLLGGATLVVQAVRDAGRGGAMGQFDWAVAVLVIAIGLLEAIGLYFDRIGAWIFTLAAAALMAMGAITGGQAHQTENILLGTSAAGLMLLTAARAIEARRARR